MLNKVMVIGRLGKSPELRNTQGGQAVCSFSVATSEKYKTRDGSQQERTEWFNVVAWGKLAELCNSYLQKGSLVYVDGKLQTSDYVDTSEIKRYKTELILKEVKFLSKNENADNRNYNAEKESPQLDTQDADLPF